jgi:hypothetical protein
LGNIDGYTRDLRAITLPEDTILEQEPSQLLEDIFYHLSTDTDQDILYFIDPFLTTEQRESYQKRKEVEDLEIAKAQPVAELQMDPEIPISLDHLTVFFSSLSNLDEDDEEEELAVVEKAMNSPIISDMDFFTSGIEDYQEEHEQDNNSGMTEVLAIESTAIHS